MRVKIGIACVGVGVAALIAALIILLVNIGQASQATAASQAVLPEIINAIEQRSEKNKKQDYYPDPYASEMTGIEVDGNAYIGYLSIPAQGLELPVMADWSYEKLNIAPCRYSGAVGTNDFVIAAHNYPGHFGYIGDLTMGETVTFVDMNGIKTVYEVKAVEALDATAVEDMIAGKFDLTLFTCDYGGGSRITVRCDKISA